MGFFKTIVGTLMICLIAILSHVVLIPVTIFFVIMFLLMMAIKPINDFIYNSDGKLTLLTGQDALWVDKDDRIPCYFTFHATMRGKVNIEKFRRDLIDRMMGLKAPDGSYLLPKFRRYVVNRGLFFYWKDESNFDIAEHVKYHDVAEIKDEEGLKDVIHKTYEHIMPEDKSKWYVDFYPWQGNKTLLIFRLQHCISDGIHFQRAISNYLIDGEFDDSVARQLTAKLSGRGTVEKFLGFARALFLMAYYMMTEIIFFKENTPFVMTGPSKGRVSSFTPPLDLNLVKKIKTAARTSVNDVMTACLAQSVKKFFLRHSMPIPKSFRAAAAVSYMGPDVKPNVMTNSLSMALLDIPMNCKTPGHALESVHRSTDLVKMSTMFLSNFLMFKYCMNYLPYWIARIMISTLENSMILTNMPIFDKKVSLCGYFIEDMGYVVPYRTKAGSSVSFVTYADEIRATVTVDKALVKERAHLDRMMKDFVSSLEELAFQVGVPTAPESGKITN